MDKLYTVRLNGEEVTYKHYSLMVEDIQRHRLCDDKIGAKTLSAYFTPYRLKRWSMPKWLRPYIIKIKVGRVEYSADGAREVH